MGKQTGSGKRKRKKETWHVCEWVMSNHNRRAHTPKHTHTHTQTHTNTHHIHAHTLTRAHTHMCLDSGQPSRDETERQKGERKFEILSRTNMMNSCLSQHGHIWTDLSYMEQISHIWNRLVTYEHIKCEYDLSVLQCVAVCCSVLQCVAVCLQKRSVFKCGHGLSVSQCVAVCL